MPKKAHTTRYTDNELTRLNEREGTRSDWAKAAKMTDVEIERLVVSDPDEDHMDVDWDEATIELPHPKVVLNMRVDRDVLEFFRRSGKGYQSRINAVLRSYVQRQEHRRSQKA